MAEVHCRKLQTLIKQQAAEGLCASCGGKVLWLLTGPLTSSSSSNFNCCSRWSVLYSHTDMMANCVWTSSLMDVVFLFLQNDTAAVFSKVKWKAVAAGNIWSLGWLLLAVNATSETSQGATSLMRLYDYPLGGDCQSAVLSKIKSHLLCRRAVHILRYFWLRNSTEKFEVSLSVW